MPLHSTMAPYVCYNGEATTSIVPNTETHLPLSVPLSLEKKGINKNDKTHYLHLRIKNKGLATVYISLLDLLGHWWCWRPYSPLPETKNAGQVLQPPPLLCMAPMGKEILHSTEKRNGSCYTSVLEDTALALQLTLIKLFDEEIP